MSTNNLRHETRRIMFIAELLRAEDAQAEPHTLENLVTRPSISKILVVT